MKKWLISISLTVATIAGAQVPVTPMQNPHPVFNDVTGLACAGCSLYSYAAGSTTPQPTYTDSTGATQNTNPVILGQDGGPLTPSGSSGAIWMGPNAYKFVLKNASAQTVFTVDNVSGGSAFPCGPAYAIQAANSSVTGFTCDSAITINTSTHALNVGTLPTNHVTIGALGTPTAWTFDTTTPATALSSLGGGTVNSGVINQIAVYPSTGTAVSGANAIPAGITAVTQPPSTNNGLVATTAYVAAPGAIAPTSLTVGTGVAMTTNQGTGTAVQHSTGATTLNHIAIFDTNGNTADSGALITPVQTVYFTGGSGTGRAMTTWYQNTGTATLDVRVSLFCGGNCNFEILTSSTNSGGQEIVGGFGTGSGETGWIAAPILPGKWYEITGDPTSIRNWVETTLP